MKKKNILKGNKLKVSACVKRKKQSNYFFNIIDKGENMGKTKKNASAKIEVTGYSEAELKTAVKEYISEPKSRRTILKRIVKTPEKVLKAVFNIIPCNWYEVIQDDTERITKRNKGHKNAVKCSYVIKA